MERTEIIKAVQKKLGLAAGTQAGADTWSAIYSNIVGAFAETADVTTLIAAVQSALGVGVTGIDDANTWSAIAGELSIDTGAVDTPTVTTGNLDNNPVDARSEGVINTLLPEVRPYARTLVHKAAGAGITIKVISGLRTYEEQDALFAQGRTKPGDIVTNAPAGHSNHNFGLAFDIGVFEGTNYIEESPKYKTVGAMGMGIGLTWGGSWTTIVDEPHFEIRPLWAANLSENDMLAELRQRKEDGRDFLA